MYTYMCVCVSVGVALPTSCRMPHHVVYAVQHVHILVIGLDICNILRAVYHAMTYVPLHSLTVFSSCAL